MNIIETCSLSTEGWWYGPPLYLSVIWVASITSPLPPHSKPLFTIRNQTVLMFWYILPSCLTAITRCTEHFSSNKWDTIVLLIQEMVTVSHLATRQKYGENQWIKRFYVAVESTQLCTFVMWVWHSSKGTIHWDYVYIYICVCVCARACVRVGGA
jgi:hypothetical protein